MDHPHPTQSNPSADVAEERDVTSAAPALPAPRVLRRAEIGLRPDERLVRSRATGTLIVAITCFALAGLVAWRYHIGAIRWGWAAAIGGFLVLLGAGLLAGWRRSLWAEAWVLGVGPERILVSLRSYLHEGLTADDPQILELPVTRVVSARRSEMRRAHRIPGESTTYTHTTYLDLRIRGMDLAPLREVLARDPGYGRAPAGHEHVLVEDGMVRVKLGSTRPGSDEVLYLLGRYVELEPDAPEDGKTRA